MGNRITTKSNLNGTANRFRTVNSTIASDQIGGWMVQTVCVDLLVQRRVRIPFTSRVVGVVWLPGLWRRYQSSRWMTAIVGGFPFDGSVAMANDRAGAMESHGAAVAMCRAWVEADSWDRTEEEPVE